MKTKLISIAASVLLVFSMTTPSKASEATEQVYQKTISSFSSDSTNLTAQQEAQVREAVEANPSAEKFICTGIRFESAPMSENIVVRKRAKAACDYAKTLNPALSTWFQNKPTKARSYAGKVLLTVKSPRGEVIEPDAPEEDLEVIEEPKVENASWDSQEPWITGLSVTTWDSQQQFHSASMIQLLGQPQGCGVLERPAGTSCVYYIRDASGAFIYDTDSSPTQLWLKESVDAYLERGGLTLIVGTEPRRRERFGPEVQRPTLEPPTAQFVQLATTAITRELIQLKQCNPLGDQISSTSSVRDREAKMADLRWEGMFGTSKSLLEDFAVGTDLDGVTQVRLDAPVTYGFPTGNRWVNHPKPTSGLYHSNSTQLTYFVLDCSRMVTRLVPEYKPFRLGKDGVIMHFNVLKYHPTTNVWVTINGKKYQVQKNGKVNTPANSPIKNCKTIDPKFYGANYFACFVPTKFGDYKISVTEQYVGSGNLIITCRGNWVKVDCSSARDKSVTASISGTFSIGPNGTQGPAWWPYNNER